MGRIQQLPPHVVSQIAAGEVIERPASVLKELLENSIDAGSSRIDVEVVQGGLEMLRVVDDGCGIEPDDLPLAFAAHATSKLRSAADLFRIGTLGFRGEGLASIGAVAQVTLQSRPGSLDHGCEIRCNGGEISDPRVWNGSPGTRIEVRHLFFNTPVRRKFLRGPGTEMGHVSEAFIRLALSQLSLHLTLRHNSKMVHDVSSSAGLLDRIGQFFGEELRRQLLMVEAEQDGMTLGGYLADPACERGGTQMQYLFVNGRWVRDRLLSQALQEAYRGLLLTGKHPLAFLFLEMPPDRVDVNVHPTKAEVRFRQPEKVQQLILAAARKRLQSDDLTAALRVRQAPPSVAVVKEQAKLPFPEPVHVAPLPPAPEETPSPRPLPAAPRSPMTVSTSRPPAQTPSPTLPPLRPVEKPAPPPQAPPSRPVRAIQMHDLYLIVEVPEGVVIIDQHALHERILFEQLKARLAAGRLEVQKLLIPEPVTLPPAQAALVLAQQEALSDLGLEVSEFGAGTVLLAGYPALLGRKPPREILQAVVDYLTSKERLPTREILLNDLMALMACHAAVRAGDRLTPDQIAELLAQRHLAQDSHHCPHGRPSSLMFTKQELDRQFRRMG
jgi:DNA mismatch repair protein MutL